MKIQIVTPAPPGSTHGNRVTAERWAAICRRLGHHVSVSQEFDQSNSDLLIALHARRSHPSIKRFRSAHPGVPMVLALTGTDVYRDIHENSRAQESLALADKIIVLQPQALDELTGPQKKKAEVIYQSVDLPALKKPSLTQPGAYFDICVIGHLRPVKDPFRTALAARLLPESSRIRIIHIGAAMSVEMEKRARAEMQNNARYVWHGALSRNQTWSSLATSKACVISSRIEGGANVLSEAIVAKVPVLASNIEGNVGILHRKYPGLFPVGNTRELMGLMLQTESDRTFRQRLQRHVINLAPRFDPKRESAAWLRLLANTRKRG